MKSKLITLYDDENFATDAISSDAGLMVNQYNETYTVLYDHRNGQIEIQKENASSLYDVKLVEKEEVLIIND